MSFNESTIKVPETVCDKEGVDSPLFDGDTFLWEEQKDLVSTVNVNREVVVGRTSDSQRKENRG